jgi:4-hydroxy-tetrahydrodipicolinate reductase
MSADTKPGVLRIAIHGAAGRMGRRLVALGAADPQLRIMAALDQDGHPQLGEDAGLLAGIAALNVPLGAKLEVEADVVIDFSSPDPAMAVCGVCQERQTALVLATTGLSDEQQRRIRLAAEKIPIVWAPNMSRAVNLTMRLACIAAQAFAGESSGADVEIIERHHRFKKDAPSGTAIRFGEIIAEAMGQTKHQHGRHGLLGERPRDEIGYHALRVGDNPGEHTIVFGLLGETVELTVRATNRDCYAMGALAAAKFLASKSPGLYSMFDVLGLDDS